MSETVGTMSDRMTCPGCNSHTSSVLSAYIRDEPCPYCGLSADAIGEVEAIRKGRGDEALKAKAAEAEVRAARAEAEVARLTAIVDRVKYAIDSDI